MKVSTSAPPAMEWAAQPVPLSSSQFSVSDQNILRRPNYDRSTNDHPTLSSLSISDPPEIELETNRVHSGINKEAHLTCRVQGNPEPIVCPILTRGAN